MLAAQAGSSSSSKHALHSAGIKSHVKVPRLNGGKMGVLATRTPHRPVPIGLSTAQVNAERFSCSHVILRKRAYSDAAVSAVI
jgi:tRNA (Thr-GGU) A37 N-methylase